MAWPPFPSDLDMEVSDLEDAYHQERHAHPLQDVQADAVPGVREPTACA